MQILRERIVCRDRVSDNSTSCMVCMPVFLLDLCREDKLGESVAKRTFGT